MLLALALACSSPPAGPTAPPSPAPTRPEPVEIPDGEPTLVLSLVSGEKSKDSRRNHYRARLVGGVLHYEGPVGEPFRGRFDHGARTVRLDPADQAALEAIIRRDLLVAVEEEGPIVSPCSYVDLTVTAALDGRSGRIRLSGMTHGSSGPTLENVELASKIASLAYDVGRLADGG